MHTLVRPASILLLGIMVPLGGCNGGGGPGTGTLNLAITDAPVDSAKSVVVEFSGVELNPAGGERILIDYDPPRQIDLLALTGGTTELLLNNESLPAGKYTWVRLHVNAEPNTVDSFIVLLDDSQHDLRIPSQTGLQLNRGFSVPEGGTASFTIDFDLRKSVHNPVGSPEYILRPTLRLVDDNEAGALAGNVDASFITADCSGAVYVFSGATTDDVDGLDPDPVNTATVPIDGEYAYLVPFLPEGTYLVAFTCDADKDDPALDADDAASGDGPVVFVGATQVTITAGTTTNQDIAP